MSVGELTRQQIDPGGTTSIRAMTSVLAVCAFLYALGMTAVGISEISNPVFTVLAIAMMGLSCITIIVGTSPYRAPFTVGTHALAHGLALAAIGFEVASQWVPIPSFGMTGAGQSRRHPDDPRPYRPAVEIASSGTISAIFIGFATLLQVDHFVTEAPPLAFVVLAVTPYLLSATRVRSSRRGLSPPFFAGRNGLIGHPRASSDSSRRA